MLTKFWQLFALVFSAAVLCHNVEGQSNNVSPKLDFDDENDMSNNNSSPPMIPNVQGRGGQDAQGHTTGNGGTSGGKGPKIHGVRVTVDTGDGQNSKGKESKESVEITDVGKHKKRVGIHTDITFEITANGDADDGNGTSSAQRNDKEDASVPIFKGRSNQSHKPRKSNDPKSRWSTNFSTERRGYDGASVGYHPHNVPAYGATHRAGGGGVADSGWNSYAPSPSHWTTERSLYIDHYRPNAVTGHQRQPSWKPCYCISTGADNRRRRNSSPAGARPTSTVIQVVDGKLERPFS